MSPRSGAIVIGLHLLLLGACASGGGDSSRARPDRECDLPFPSTMLSACGGGISGDGGQTFITTGEFHSDDTLRVVGVMPVEESHVGRPGRQLALAVHDGRLFQRDGEHWIIWDGNLDTLTTAGEVHPLEAIEYIEAASSLSGLGGDFEVYVGYRLGGDIFYKRDPIRFSVP